MGFDRSRLGRKRMKSIVRVMCWKQSHVTDLAMNRAQENKLSSDIPKMKKVCPNCKPANEAITIVLGASVFNPAKAYKCEQGHLSLLSPLGSTINVCFGPGNDEYVNIEGSLADLENLIDEKDIACNHVVDGKLCDCKLTAVDDFQLDYPRVNAIKTKQRIGDIWDKHGIQPVRSGSYDGNGGYNESETQRSNAKRLDRIRKNRNTPVDRHPGKAIKKATKHDYGYRDKSSVNPDRLE